MAATASKTASTLYNSTLAAAQLHTVKFFQISNRHYFSSKTSFLHHKYIFYLHIETVKTTRFFLYQRLYWICLDGSFHDWNCSIITVVICPERPSHYQKWSLRHPLLRLRLELNASYRCSVSLKVYSGTTFPFCRVWVWMSRSRESAVRLMCVFTCLPARWRSNTHFPVLVLFFCAY